MKRVILLVVGLVVGAGGVLGQGNPFWLTETWRIEVDPFGTTSNHIDSYWSEEGRAKFLIRTSSNEIVTDGNQILWQHQYQNGGSYATSIDFGLEEGVGIVVADWNYLTYYYGENYESELEVGFQSIPYRPEENWVEDRYDIRLVLPATPGLQDSTRRVIAGAYRTSRKDGNGDPWYELVNSDGVYHILSFSGNIDTSFVSFLYPEYHHIVSSDDDESDRIIIFGQHENGVLDEHGPNVSSAAGYVNFNYYDNQIHGTTTMLEGCYFNWSSDIVKLPNGEAQIVAGLTYGFSNNRVVRFGLPALGVVASLRCDFINNRRWFVVKDPRTNVDYILLYSDTPHFQLIRLDGYIEKNFLWTPENENLADLVCDDIDNDGVQELLVLTENNLICYAIHSLNIINNSFVIPPSSIILSSYPNPFNSSTTINYSLPRPGRYAVDVVDISGRLVLRLSDGWREAGSYREVWDAGQTVAGSYRVVLCNELNQSIFPVTLVK